MNENNSSSSKTIPATDSSVKKQPDSTATAATQNTNPTPPVTSEPSTSTNAPATKPEDNQTTPAPTPVKNTKSPFLPKKLLLVIVIAVVILLLLGLSTASALVAYNVIPMKNSQLKNTLTKFIMSIPLTPKTPEYILTTSLETHKKIKTGYIEASIAIEGEQAVSMASIIGGNSLDAVFKGSFDITDTKNPTFNLTALMGTDVNIETIVKDKALYFNIKEIPATVQSVAGMYAALTSEDYIDRWFSYDLKELDSEARRTLDANKTEEENVQAELYEELYKRLYTEKILKHIKVSTDKLDGASVHKLTLDADKTLLAEIIDEMVAIAKETSKSTVAVPSDFTSYKNSFESVKMEAYFNKSNYVMKSFNLIIKAKTPDMYGGYNSLDTGYAAGSAGLGRPLNTTDLPDSLPSTEGSDITVVFSLKMDKVGEQFTVEIPQNVTTVKDFIDEITVKIQEKYQRDLEARTEGELISEDFELPQTETTMEYPAELPYNPSSESASDTAFGKYILGIFTKRD